MKTCFTFLEKAAQHVRVLVSCLDMKADALYICFHTHAYEIITEKQTHADTACKIVTDALRGADIMV